MDDYYEIVGVDRTASREAIDRALRDQLRHWQQRSSSADLDRRQEAERRVRQLGEARAMLLDDEQRRRFDHHLGEQLGEQPGEREPRDVPPAPPERGRFDMLPKPVPPHAWVEEVPGEARYEPPENRLGSPYGYES